MRRPDGPVAQVEVVVLAAVVVDVVVADEGGLDVARLHKGGEEARVEVGVEDALLGVADFVSDELVLEDRDVEECQRGGETAPVGGADHLRVLAVPRDLVRAHPVVAADARLLAVGARVKEVQVGDVGGAGSPRTPRRRGRSPASCVRGRERP